MAKSVLKIVTNEKGNTKTKTIKYSTRDPETVQVNYSIDGKPKLLLGEINYGSSLPPDPPVDKPPVVEAGEDVTVKQGVLVTLDGSASDDGTITSIEWIAPDGITVTRDQNDETKAQFTAPQLPANTDLLLLNFTLRVEDEKGHVSTDQAIVTVTKEGTMPPPPPPPDTTVLYDSHRDSKLHDGNVRTITKEGNITPNGLGIECRASGSPHVRVNEDGTFSLLDDDLGRFYGYVCNYNATMELECAFWNSGDQTLSLKMRSRHNEGGAEENRFGGYGFAVKKDSWDAKREDYHNVHTSMGSGKLSSALKVQQYFTVVFTVKDEGNGVRQIGKVNDEKVFDKLDSSPKPYMVDESLYAKQSYYWVRQNTTILAELRIKSLRIVKA